VQVRLLLDAVGCLSLSMSAFHELRAAGGYHVFDILWLNKAAIRHGLVFNLSPRTSSMDDW
jgi:phosphatidylserine/phosphatidylglycerophosphate/cardiolipin synthase-like enzyme